jgi:hypothetical protein
MINWFEKHSKITITIAMIIAIAIFVISSLQFKPGEGNAGSKAIIYHIGIFFLLSLFMLLSLVKRKEFRLIPIIILLAGVYAALDELHQYFVPGRYMSLLDFGFDMSGILLSAAIYVAISKTIFKRI